ncbi:MAG: hypothetical protein V3W07_11530, partial [Syntrophobacteria bacterium]
RETSKPKDHIIIGRIISRSDQQRSLPKNANCDPDTGKGYSTTSDSQHFMAMFLLTKHHIFMHALARLRYLNAGCSNARCFAAYPYAFAGVSSE